MKRLILKPQDTSCFCSFIVLCFESFVSVFFFFFCLAHNGDIRLLELQSNDLVMELF